MLSSPLTHDCGFKSYGATRNVLTSSSSFDDKDKECYRDEQHRSTRGSIVFAALLIVALATLLLFVDEKVLDNSLTSASSLFTPFLGHAVESASYESDGDVSIIDQSAPCIFHDVRCSLAKEDKVCYLNPLDYELCLEGIALRKNHVLQTIQSLDDIFQQYYVFYDIAKNPMATALQLQGSEDLEYYENQFDLHNHLQNLQRDILHNKGASSVATFWDVAESFHHFRDAHVTALQGKLGNLSSDFFSGIYDFVVLPECYWNHINSSQSTDNHTDVPAEACSKMQMSFYFDANHDIQLDLQRYNSNEITPVQSQVKEIDGDSPHNFLLRLAHSSASRKYKSVGPRINSLVKYNFPTIKPQNWFFCLLGNRVRPTHIPLPARLEIKYAASSQRETMYSKIAVPLGDWREIIASQLDNDKDLLIQLEGTVTIDMAKITEKANEPGCIYRHFTHFQNTFQGIGRSRRLRQISNKSLPILSGTTSDVNEEIIKPIGVNQVDGKPSLNDDIVDQSCDTSNVTWFKKAYNCTDFEPPFDDDGPLEVAFKVLPEDGCAIFKIDSFDAPPDIIFPLWQEMSREATKAGVDKLIVDIAYNGGGEVPMGLNLARLMYPDIDCEHFDNKYDMVYNKPMKLWAQKVKPLLSNLHDSWLNLSNNEKRQMAVDLSSRAQSANDFLHLVEAMCIMDLDHGEEDYCGPMEVAARQNCSLYAAASSFAEAPKEMPSLDLFMDQLFEFIKKSNPWSETAKSGVFSDIGDRVRIRGDNVKATFTEYLTHEPDYPIWWECAKVPVMSNPFSSYVILGSGNSGSTANTFLTTVEQIWKHRDQSGATRSLSTVSFGGLPQDTPLTQFAGGTMDDRVSVEDPFVGLLGLQMLSSLFPASMTQGLDKVAALLKGTIPEVPYFISKLPRMTVCEIYNKFMLDQDGEAMPLEFVFLPADEHIEAFFPGTIFEGSEGLATLYEKASHFFS